MLTRCRTLLLILALLGPASAYAQKWSGLATISATSTMVTNTLCYSDGRDMACDGAAGLLITSGTFYIPNISTTNISLSTINGQAYSAGGSGDRITSGTTSMVAISTTKIISITTNGVNTGYFNSNGVLTVPGISATTNLTSVTSLYASGLVGIGTTSASVPLDIENATNDAAGTPDLKVGSAFPLYLNSNFPSVNFNMYWDGSTFRYGKGSSSSYGGVIDVSPFTGNMEFYATPNAGNAAAATSASIAMIINKNGNVGINTISPTTKLEVNGTISATNLVVNGVSITGGGGGGGSIDDLSDAISDPDGSGAQNLFLGFGSGVSTTGIENTATGLFALGSNTNNGNLNTAAGYGALSSSTSGNGNTAIGVSTLGNKITGDANTAIGVDALLDLNSGTDNVAIGDFSGGFITSGDGNIAIGANASDVNDDTGSNQLNIGNVIYGGLTNGYIGINVTSPTVALEVGGTISATALVVNGVSITGGGGGGGSIDDLSDAISDPDDSGTENLFLGYGSGVSITIGWQNTGTGLYALASNEDGAENTADGNSALYSNGSGSYNVAIGAAALQSNITGGWNIAVGQQALGAIDGGDANVALGNGAGEGLTTGDYNIAIGANANDFNDDTGSNQLNIGNVIYGGLTNGYIGINVISPTVALEVGGTISATNFVGDGTELTLFINTLGDATKTDSDGTGGQSVFLGFASGPPHAYGGTGMNTATGLYALGSLTGGHSNVAYGYAALNGDTTGHDNTAVGWSALASNTTAGNNTAVGFSALNANTTGRDNTAVGWGALSSNLAANGNSAFGEGALAATTTGIVNTAIGENALSSIDDGAGNIALGSDAGSNQTTGDGNIIIGQNIDVADTAGSEQLNIGNVIWGDLSNGFIGIDTLTPSVQLEVNGTISATDLYLNGTHFTGGGGSIDDLSDAISDPDSSSNNNLFLGYQSGVAVTTGGNDTATGLFALGSVQDGSDNTANGEAALNNNIDGSQNTANGVAALYQSTGDDNTAMGYNAGFSLTTGDNNIAIGANTSDFNDDAGSNQLNIGNVIYGDLSNGYIGINVLAPSVALEVNGTISATDLYLNGTHFTGGGGGGSIDDLSDAISDPTDSGAENLLLGYPAGANLTTGNQNTATGLLALANIQDGTLNTAVGYSALIANTSGNYNTALGYYTLLANVTGNDNIAVGDQALLAVDGSQDNVAMGDAALAELTSGNDNVGIGVCAGCDLTTGDNNIAIGANTYDFNDNTGSNQLNLGNVIWGDLSNGYIGINVMNPTVALEVNGTISTTSLYVGGVLFSVSGSGITAGGGGGASTIDDLSDAISDPTDSGAENLMLGYGGGANLTTGTQNTATGLFALDSVQDGYDNTANGFQALFFNRSGGYNTAIGTYALSGISTGGDNTAVGDGALGFVDGGNNNVGIGACAGCDLNTGDNNIAIGGSTYDFPDNNGSNQLNLGNVIYGDLLNGYIGIDTLSPTVALEVNGTISASELYIDGVRFSVSGSGIMAGTGATSLDELTDAISDPTDSGAENLMLGYADGGNLTTGNQNTATGLMVLSNVQDGRDNSAYGYSAMNANTGGSWNTAIGDYALANSVTGDDNTAVGDGALGDVNGGSNNVGIGDCAGCDLDTGDNNIAIGANTYDFNDNNGSNQLNLGNVIYGDLSNGYIGINVMAPSVALEVGGTISATDLYLNGTHFTGGGGGGGGSIDDLSDAISDPDDSGNENLFLGFADGIAITTGNLNTGTGLWAMSNTQDGRDNTANGYSALWSNISGNFNTAIGFNTLDQIDGGNLNVALGEGAGGNQTTGDGNIIIGAEIDVNDTAGSNQLNIGNVIFGDLSNGYIGIDTLTPSVQLEVNGTISATDLYLNGTHFTGGGGGGGGSIDDLSDAISDPTDSVNGNLFLGADSGVNVTTGANNTGTGLLALNSLQSGIANVADGGAALYSNISGNSNVAMGVNALEDSTGNFNTALGNQAGSNLVAGSHNIIIGGNISDFNDNSGSNQLNIGNVIYGDLLNGYIGINVMSPSVALEVGGTISATDLYLNGTHFTGGGGGGGGSIDDLSDAISDPDDSGNENLFLGYGGGAAITTGTQNTGAGLFALGSNQGGSGNVANGYNALGSNTSGAYNTAIGIYALNTSVADIDNIAIGDHALDGLNGGNSNIGIGYCAGCDLSTGDNNIAIGALTYDFNDDNGSNQLNIGNVIFGGLTNGYIGINVISPTVALEVGGTISATDLYVNGTHITGGGGGSIDDLSDAISDPTNASTGSVFLGYRSGIANTGARNTGVGLFALENNVDGNKNSAFGNGALDDNVSGSNNTAVGEGALQDNLSDANTAVGEGSLFQNLTGSANTAYGVNSLGFNTTGNDNTAVGPGALFSLDGGTDNVAIGDSAGGDLTTGDNNIAIGANTFDFNDNTGSNQLNISNVIWGDLLNGYIGINTMTPSVALEVGGTISATALVVNGVSITGAGGSMSINDLTDASSSVPTGNIFLGLNSGNNTTGSFNTVVGHNSMIANTTGSNNIALGANSLASNTTGTGNTVLGDNAMQANTTGENNVSVGSGSLVHNTTGNDNIVMAGVNGMFENTTGNNNFAAGSGALSFNSTGSENVSIGFFTLFSDPAGANNVAVGASALSSISGSYNTALGPLAAAFQGAGDGNIAIGYDVVLNNDPGDNQLNIGNVIYGGLTNGYIGINVTSPTVALEVGGTISATALVVNGVSITSGGGGASKLASLTDVDVSGKVSGSVLVYTGATTSWTALPIQAVMSTTTMVTNWPDAFQCTDSGNQATFYLDGIYGGLYMYGNDGGSEGFGFNSDGTFNASVSYGGTTNCDGKTISQLYTAGQAFNFIGSAITSASIVGGGAGAGDRISTSGVASGATLGMVVADKGTISFTLAGTAGAAYIHPTLGFVGPGVSVTGVVSATSLYANSKVGIGTTAPTDLLHVYSTADTKGITIDRSSNATVGTGLSFDTAGVLKWSFGTDNDSTDNLYLYGSTGAVQSWKLSNGYVGINLTTPNAQLDVNGIVSSTGVNVTGDISYTGILTDVSDRRKKHDIKPLPFNSAMDRIMLMKPVQFKMNDRPDRIEWGFVAQDVEQVFPNLVFTANDAMGSKTLNYIGLLSPMVQGMQELQKENDDLRKRLDKLEKLVEAQQRHK